MKRAIAGAVIAFCTISLAACNSSSAAKPESRSATCAALCSDLESLATDNCTRPDVHNCAPLLTDKVRMADKVEASIENEELSDTVGYIHTKVQLIGTLGSKFGTSKCYDEGTNLGDRLFECRTTAKDMDDRFAELLDLVQQLPA